MSRPSIATAPGCNTRAPPSIVTTIPPLTTSDTLRRAGCCGDDRPTVTTRTAHHERSIGRDCSGIALSVLGSPLLGFGLWALGSGLWDGRGVLPTLIVVRHGSSEPRISDR